MSVTFNPIRRDDEEENNWVRFDGEGLNVGNSNARDILANLGLNPHFEAEGVYPLEQFEAECSTFLRIAAGGDADAAKPARALDGRSLMESRVIDCGRREGYLSVRISKLGVMSAAALAAGFTHMSCG